MNANTNKYLLSEFEGKIGIQMQNWRFYYDANSKKPVDLYNLTTDPKEKTNLIKDKKEKLSEFMNLVKKLNIKFN